MSGERKQGDSRDSRLRQTWIEAMLRALNPQSEEERIGLLLEKLDKDVAPSSSVSMQQNWASWSIPWKSLAIAALVLISVVAGVYQSTSNSASAAVLKSLEAISELQTRQYDLFIEIDAPGFGELTIQDEVYVQGLNKFVVRHAGLPGEIWLGTNGDESYWICDSSEEVEHCTTQEFFEWLDSRWEPMKLPRSPRNTPFLHVASALEIMSERCQLEELEDAKVDLADGTQLECRHIRGKPLGAHAPNPPESIDLWISQEFNIPVQVIAKWSVNPQEDELKSTVQMMKLHYRGQPQVAEDWFTPEAHLSGN